MRNKAFYRNVRARDHLSLFFITAVLTVLGQRFFLYVTGYPQLSAGSLHIAHMLYGGLFMMIAIVLLVSFLGERIRNIAAFIGGVGFGFFIDELGKFITKDNDYFFRPTIGLIYGIFVIIFLVFNYLSRQSRLSDHEYELNALNQFEEAILQDLDPGEKRRIHELLAKVEKPSHITKSLRHMLAVAETVPTPRPRIIKKLLASVSKHYAKFWQQTFAGWFISIVFVGQALIFFGVVLYTLVSTFNTGIGITGTNDGYANRLLIAEAISTAISVALAIAGAVELFKSRLEAFDLFRDALMVNIFLTEFFLFTRIQFAALPSMMFNLALLAALYIAMGQERRIRRIA